VVPLMFHRVLRDADCHGTYSLPGIILLEHTFRELVSHVARRYEVVDLRASEPGVLGSKLRVAFTFDDGWIDTYTVAFPITREHRIPFVVFVCPELIDENSPFWPEQIIALMRAAQPLVGTEETEKLIERLKKATPGEREQFIAKLRESEQAKPVEPVTVDRTFSWAAVAEMAGQGVSIGSHTNTHQIVTMIPPDEVRKEVRESKSAIEQALTDDCDIFAYPNGNWSPETRDLVAEAGYKLAVTTASGAWTSDCDRLAIPRINICEDNVVSGLTGCFSAAMFEYATFWKAWRAAKVTPVGSASLAGNSSNTGLSVEQ
jgi:peptidoglycan/xylan/chitin deacetylase (PgdA/CDA1 family)